MAEINGVMAGLKTKLRKFKSEFGMEFKERVEARTPVKTGALKGGWGFTLKKEDIEIYNTKDYASFVEYGTERMAPRGMLRATILESNEIAEIAAERSGLKR